MPPSAFGAFPSTSMMAAMRAVVITGASTGIGEACALDLDRRGFHVFAGVRRERDAERLKGAASERLRPIILDVTKTEQIGSAADLVKSEIGADGLAGLVNNAGFTVAGPVEFLDMDDIRWQFEVNFFGAIAVTQAFLSLLRDAKGRIVNMSSIGGRFASPYASPYTASKFAMEAWSDSMRIELDPWDIEVSVVEPGNIKTPLWKKSIEDGVERRKRLPPEAETLYREALDGMIKYATRLGGEGIPPQKVADAVAHALTSDKPKTRYLVGSDAKQRAFVARWIPDRIRDKLVLSELRKRA